MSKRTADSQATQAMTRTEWTRLPANPDVERDLGYQLVDWNVVGTGPDGDGQYVFLPKNDELLRDDAFIVADEQSVCDVTNRT